MAAKILKVYQLSNFLPKILHFFFSYAFYLEVEQYISVAKIRINIETTNLWTTILPFPRFGQRLNGN
jgi:hypothetical protein